MIMGPMLHHKNQQQQHQPQHHQKEKIELSNNSTARKFETVCSCSYGLKFDESSADNPSTVAIHSAINNNNLLDNYNTNKISSTLFLDNENWSYNEAQSDHRTPATSPPMTLDIDDDDNSKMSTRLMQDRLSISSSTLTSVTSSSSTNSSLFAVNRSLSKSLPLSDLSSTESPSPPTSSSAPLFETIGYYKNLYLLSPTLAKSALPTLMSNGTVRHIKHRTALLPPLTPAMLMPTVNNTLSEDSSPMSFDTTQINCSEKNISTVATKQNLKEPKFQPHYDQQKRRRRGRLRSTAIETLLTPIIPTDPATKMACSPMSVDRKEMMPKLIKTNEITTITTTATSITVRSCNDLNRHRILPTSLSIMPKSIITPIIQYPLLSLLKFYRYLIIMFKTALSKRLASQLMWIIGLAVAAEILPINLVNASSLLSTNNASHGSNSSDNMSYEDEALGNATEKTPLFPKDLFTTEELRNGAVILHVIGVIYMFVALAIVCDEFFVPSLDVIIEKLGITDDVAGATFMAAGGSAPELFTSVIGVFVSFDDVGIGTIVGSAVFNILFVIGMCAIFSKTVLTLTWWPLFRDCSFYSVSLLILIYFFRDNLIYWWEALVLFFIYAAYVGFMKWNQQVERCVKKVIYKNKVTRVRSTDQLMPAGNAANSSETSMATQPGGSVTSRAASESRSGPPGSSSGATGNSSTHAGSTVTGAKFRHGLLQLMIHTIDPLHDGKVDEKATQLHAIASLKVLLDATKPQRGAATTSAANHVKINLKETTLASDRPNGNIDTTIDSGNELEEESEALSMSWPSTGRKRITYLMVAPILFPLWLTLPDTRTPRGKRFFPVTFIGSILWIAAYSYLMVWWANIIGDTAGIPPEVMGLTFLAAGTSIPDLITSVIVARKGFGDMAVSSSVGSNIFDVTVGLPIPWLLYGIIYQEPVTVNSVGMVCSITILFMMLLFVVLSIACFRWRMNKGLGLTMFVLYFVFVAVSLMFEYKTIVCPV